MKDNVIDADRIGDTDYQVTMDLSKADAANITEKLRSFVETHEGHQHEIEVIKSRQKDVIEDVKLSGLSVKAFREVIRRRRQDPDDVRELDRKVSFYERLLRDDR